MPRPHHVRTGLPHPPWVACSTWVQPWSLPFLVPQCPGARGKGSSAGQQLVHSQHSKRLGSLAAPATMSLPLRPGVPGHFFLLNLKQKPIIWPIFHMGEGGKVT